MKALAMVAAAILMAGCTTTGTTASYTGIAAQRAAENRVEIIDVSILGQGYLNAGFANELGTACTYGGGVLRILGRWIFESIGFAPATPTVVPKVTFPSDTNAPAVKVAQ